MHLKASLMSKMVSRMLHWCPLIEYDVIDHKQCLVSCPGRDAHAKTVHIMGLSCTRGPFKQCHQCPGTMPGSRRPQVQADPTQKKARPFQLNIYTALQQLTYPTAYFRWHLRVNLKHIECTLHRWGQCRQLFVHSLSTSQHRRFSHKCTIFTGLAIETRKTLAKRPCVSQQADLHALRAHHDDLHLQTLLARRRCWQISNGQRWMATTFKMSIPGRPMTLHSLVQKIPTP